MKSEDLESFRIVELETDLYICADKNLSDIAYYFVKKYRKDIIDYIKRDNNFLDSLVPVFNKKNSPEIVVKMCEASKIVNVGPMASVAGGISEMVGMQLLKNSNEVIIENGGDIFLKSERTRVIGIYPGKNSPFNNLGIKVKPNKHPLGICTSSGILGHSLSFGKASAVVILSRSAFLADAVATSVCNLIKDEKLIEYSIDYAKKIEGVLGILIIINDKIGIWGDIEITKG